ncbi:MAG TPA: Cthe_2314 family HEPN domain-containing protein [Candidatus Saccharibacteria bacterium]|nr:Cthe_2314 family HEPN domain-containing protein [Candidatus Saccharibacteria bacterium]
MIDQERLHTTIFAKQTTEDSKSMALRLQAAQKAGEQLKSSEREEYIHQVADSFLEIQDAVDCLDMAEVFLKSYSVSKSWKDRYDQHHYFRYHYESWVLNAIKVYERILILVNSVYWLEIPHKEITFLTVSQHPKLQNTKTLLLLNKVHGALSQLQALKNTVFHRYAYTDDDLRTIKIFSMLARHGKDKERVQFANIAKVQMRSIYLPEKRKEIESNNKQILKIVDSIFNALELPYIERRDALDSTLQLKQKT